MKMNKNSNGVDEWSEGHNGSLALARTVIGMGNVLLSLLIVLKVFEVI